MSSEQISCVLWYRFRSIVTLSILWSLWISESAEEGQCLDKQIFSMTSVLGWGQEHMLISESEDSKGSLETLKVPTLSQTAWELRSKHSGIQNNISSFRNDSEACGSLWPATEKKNENVYIKRWSEDSFLPWSPFLLVWQKASLLLSQINLDLPKNTNKQTKEGKEVKFKRKTWKSYHVYTLGCVLCPKSILSGDTFCLTKQICWDPGSIDTRIPVQESLIQLWIQTGKFTVQVPEGNTV